MLLSARRLFAERRVRRIVLELVPGRWESMGSGYTLASGIEAVAPLFAGWSCRIVCPGRPMHHGRRFEWSVAFAFDFMWIKRWPTVCDNLDCIAPWSSDQWPS